MGSSGDRKRHRREVRAAALRAIVGLSDDDLRNMRHELGRLMGVKARELEDLRQRLEALKLEAERRSTKTPAGLHISDHALVRYLERVKGVDIAAVRAEIGAIALAAKTERSGRRGVARNGELVIGVNDIDGHVTTIYSDRECVVLGESAEGTIASSPSVAAAPASVPHFIVRQTPQG